MSHATRSTLYSPARQHTNRDGDNCGMPADRNPLRVLEHALLAGDHQLAQLIAARLFPGAVRTLLVLRERLRI
jgi:hypothetical protein